MPVTSSVALGGLQLAGGLAQYFKGRSMAKKNKFTPYQIPEEVKQNMSQAQLQAYQGLPESSKEQYVNNLQRSSNFALNAMGDRKAGLTGLSALVQNQNDAYNNLMSQDAQAKQNNLANLMNIRSQVAGYRDKEYEMNKLMPYQQKAEAAQGLMGSGLQNTFSGLQSLAGTLTNNSLYGDNTDNGNGGNSFGQGLRNLQTRRMLKNYTFTPPMTDTGEMPPPITG